MPLETATFINGLNSANPAASDGLNNADDHMRLTKAAILATFPNISGAVTASHTQLNSMLSQLLGTTIYNAPLGTVGAPGYAFIGDLDTGWYSPAANRAALSLGGVDALNFAADKTANFAAGASFAGVITGPGVTPIGGMIMWLTDTLPAGNGVWCWANGGTLSRTTVGAGKELFDLVGTTYGVGNGSTTFNVINMQEVTPVGKTGMGGAASPGLLASITLGLRNVLNGIFGADTHTLTTAQLATHSHANTVSETAHRHATIDGGLHGTQYSVGPSGSQYTGASGSYQGILLSTQTTGLATAGVTISNADAGSGSAHNNVQPSRAVNFIIRIA